MVFNHDNCGKVLKSKTTIVTA